MNTNHEKSSKVKLIAAIVIVAIFLMLFGFLLGYYFYNESIKMLPNVVEQQEESEDDAMPIDDKILPADTQEQVVEERKITRPPATGSDLSVSWQKPERIASLGLFAARFETPNAANNDWGSKYYKVGKISSGSYIGGDLIVIEAPCDGMCFNPPFYRFVQKDGALTFLMAVSDPIYYDDGSGSYIKSDLYSTNNTIRIADLDYPQVFIGRNSREIFELKTGDIGWFDEKFFTKVFTSSEVGDVYIEKPEAVKLGEENYRRNSNGFYLRAPDGTRRVYALKMDFIDSRGVADVTWLNGEKNYQNYAITMVSGCGSQNYLDVIQPDLVNQSRDLELIGRSGRGDSIFGLRNSNHEILKSIYNDGYYPASGKKISYTDFLNMHPAFFYTDSFNRLIKFQNNEFVTPGECGKPVIYLYPQKTTDIQVKVKPAGGFTYTDPVYNEETGWLVRATPQGKLTELVSGKKYPYLFWEGKGGLYEQPNKGFVISQKEVHSFLIDKLAALGLNKQESADFIEFWEPRMQGSPYYFVTFLGNQAMNSIAPLDVTPQPQTVIRVLMDFSPLDKPINVESIDIKTPTRKGFTLVEWGGVIR